MIVERWKRWPATEWSSSEARRGRGRGGTIMGNATTKSHYSKSQPLAATRRPRWEGSGRERHTHIHWYWFSFLLLLRVVSDTCPRISIPRRDDQGSMRHPGRAVDRHLDRAFDSTRQSFSFSFARIIIYIYTLLYIFVSPRIFFCLERRGYCYFDLISRDLWDRNSWFSSRRNEGGVGETWRS